MTTGDFKNNTDASAAPLLLFLVTIFVVGALYTLFFIEIAMPLFTGYIPASDSKTLTMMIFYGLPMIILFVGGICLIKAGQKRTIGGV